MNVPMAMKPKANTAGTTMSAHGIASRMPTMVTTSARVTSGTITNAVRAPHPSDDAG